jgi:hypothetical protein
MYKYDLDPTPPDLLEALARTARERLRYVYLGNVPERKKRYVPPAEPFWCVGKDIA